MRNAHHSGSRFWLWMAAGIAALTWSNDAPACGEDDAGAPSQELRKALIPLDGIPGAAPATSAPSANNTPEMHATIEQARIDIEDGRFQSAAESLAKAAKTAENQAEVHYLLAKAKARMGRFNEARAPAERAARLNHGDVDTHYLLARLYRGEGRIEEAVAQYRTVTLAAERELNNSNITRAWYSLGQLLELEGCTLAAAQAYAGFDRALWQTHPERRNDPEMGALLSSRPRGMTPRRLELLRSIERYEDALAVAEWARSIWPDAVVIAREYARALLDVHQSEKAFQFSREQINDPAKAQVLLPIAIEAAAAAGRLNEWLDELVQRVQEADRAEPRRGLIKALEQVGDSPQVVRVGRLLLEKNPEDEEIAWKVAAAQHGAGKPLEALKTLMRLVRGRPGWVEESPRRLALWMEWFQDYPNISETVLELRSSSADFATDFVLGVSALAADEPTLADELLQACIDARPDFAAAYMVQGEMLLANYQWTPAVQFAREVLEQHDELAAARFLLARAHAGLDQNDEAERAFKAAIKSKPENSTYTLALAQHYRRQSELRGAQRYFQQTLSIEPGSGEALEGLIDCYLRGGKIEIARAALERLDRALIPAESLRRIDTLMKHLDDPFGPAHLAELRRQFEQFPDDIASARLLAGGLYFRGEIEQTREVVSKASARYPDDYHLTILSANIHAVLGDFDRACDTLTTQRRRYPNRLAVLQPLAVNALNAFRLEEGREILRRLMELDPEEILEYRTLLLRSFVEFGEYEQARRTIDEWVEQNPGDEALVRQRIAVLIDGDYKDEAFEIVKRRFDENSDDQRRIEFIAFGIGAEHYAEVIEVLREMLKDNPDNADMTEKLIEVQLAAELPDEALQAAQEFEGTYAESLRRRIWLGKCQASKGAFDTAIGEFEALLAERGMDDEQRSNVRFQLITTLIEAERYDDGLERCERWLSEAANRDRRLMLETLQYKRYLLQSAERNEQYEATMELLLRFNPGDAGLMNDLGYSWVDAGVQLERATEMLKTAVAAEPWNAAFLDSLGWAYYKAGDFSNARKYLSRAARLREGRDPLIYDHLADAACRLGDVDAAREYWEKAAALIEAPTATDQQRNMDLITAARAKLAALQRSEVPNTAPTAAEQNEE